MDHVELVEALKDPAFYDPPVEQVEFVQTHISSVFLTGDRVYKLKKPVNFGFLDFSSVELRERYCRAEVELNRRLAPEVYLGVEAITLEEVKELSSRLIQDKPFALTTYGPVKEDDLKEACKLLK